ncbi:MAG TPA: nickel-dependent lactate racemase [Terriglobales bacterium]|jgi:nickel-dependent lactate racemase|nr:nickel-dependent lactate racemase [Terriglobales bacterium]
MKLKLDYGSEGLTVDLPEQRTTVIEPMPLAAVANPAQALRNAIRAPIGKAPLNALVRPGRSIAISVCDITRAQPRRLMLEALFAEMPGIRRKDVTIFIATGTHRRNTPAEIEKMIGAGFARSCRVVCHDARDSASLVHVGDTASGVRVLLNREWVESDFKITTGFVEPHFFAGFSGGPKMVAPGLAGLETVMTLHNAERISHPKATFGVIEGNPIHDDVREIARMTGVDFALDVTLNREQKITAAFAGDLFAEHGAACAAVREAAMRPVQAPFDVVVTTNSGYPLDQNLYQAVKGMSAAAKIVKEAGTIICAAECRDGIPNHGAYGELLTRSASARALLDMIMAPGFSSPDQWQVQIQAQIQLKARVLVKAGGLSANQLRAAHFEPIEDVEAAVREALKAAGPNATLCVLPQGPQTVPYIK